MVTEHSGMHVLIQGDLKKKVLIYYNRLQCVTMVQFLNKINNATLFNPLHQAD